MDVTITQGVQYDWTVAHQEGDTMQPDTTGAREARADLVLARDLVTQAVQAESVADLDNAAAMIGRALRAMCPHDETT
jgi:hypothetical protein